METNYDDFSRMRDFFYTLGISNETSMQFSRTLLGKPHDVGSQIKLARKISWQNFNLQDIGLDEIDSEAVEQALRRDFPDVFADKRNIESSSLITDSNVATVKPEGKPKSKSKLSTGSRELHNLLRYSPEDTPQIANKTDSAADITSSPIISNISNPRETSALKLAATTRSGLVSVGSSNAISTTSDNNENANNSRCSRSSNGCYSGTNDEIDDNNDRNNKNGSTHKSGGGRNTKLLTSYKNDEFPSKSQKIVLQNISGQCKVNKADFTCSGLNYDDPKGSSSKVAEHPIVGCRDYPVSKGKWYYEATITNGAHVGWADSRFLCDKDGKEFLGVGDDEHSWAHDGSALIHGRKSIANKSRDDSFSYENGGYIGCAVNLDLFQLTFYLMREDDSGFSVIKFRKIEFHDSLYPCVSFDEGEAVRFNFGTAPFRMKIPKDFLPYADNIQALGGDVGDRAKRLKMRGSDGFRAQLDANLEKNDQLDAKITKDQATEEFSHLSQQQWVALGIKMQKEKMDLLSIEVCKEKDLSYNRKKLSIIYYFKKARLGWLQGKVHARTQGPESSEFNWVCDFSKERKAFRLDDDLYITNKDLLEGKGAYEASDRSWCIFEKTALKRKRKISGRSEKRGSGSSSKRRGASKSARADASGENDVDGGDDDVDDKDSSDNEVGIGGDDDGNDKEDGHDDDDSDGICSVDEGICDELDDAISARSTFNGKGTGISDVNSMELSNVKDKASSNEEGEKVNSNKEGKKSDVDDAGMKLDSDTTGMEVDVEETTTNETSEMDMKEGSVPNDNADYSASDSVKVISLIDRQHTVGVAPSDHGNEITGAIVNGIIDPEKKVMEVTLLKVNATEQEGDIIDEVKESEHVITESESDGNENHASGDIKRDGSSDKNDCDSNSNNNGDNDNKNSNRSNNDVVDASETIKHDNDKSNDGKPVPAPQTWYYTDPQEAVHGPYDTDLMRQWFERKYLLKELPIKLNGWLKFHPLGVVFTDKEPFLPSTLTLEPLDLAE